MALRAEKDGIAPTISSATHGSDTLTINWSVCGSISVVGTSGLSLSNRWQRVELLEIQTTDATTTAKLSRLVMEGEELTLSYLPGDFTDSAQPANQIAAFSDYPVTNDSSYFSFESPGSIRSARLREQKQQ